MTPPIRPLYQRGVLIIELMVAMVLALIAILAILSLYKSTAKSTAESNLGANIDGQIAVALVSADRLLQGAGYGYASGSNLYGTQLQAFKSGSTVTLGGAGDALVWMTSASACQAIVASGASLTFYGSGSGYACTGPTLPPSGTSGQTLIRAPSVTLPNAASAGYTTLTVSQPSGGCLPFGIASPASGGAYRVQLSTMGYAASQAIQSSTCLFNYH